ncbi:MAG: toll/interleukin-1 receptor domain-containing protein [Steroidobacteraceae bacterium]
MPHDVFVSYAQADREPALALTCRLEAAGLRCWIAPRDISPAADWAQEILDAIAGCRIMLLLFSAGANGSPHVRREVERAVHRKITLLPLRIENVLPTGSLEYFLSTQQWLDAFPGPLEAHGDRICARVRALLQAPPGGTAEPPADPSKGGPVRFTEAELRAIERELAAHVGPVARYMVRRASTQAIELAELVRLLAAEIDSEPGRREFLDSCQVLSRGH